jgi:hypothetical protein
MDMFDKLAKEQNSNPYDVFLKIALSRAINLSKDLEIYTCVRMAKKDIENGNISSAISRMKVDADKIRQHSRFIYRVLMNYEEDKKEFNSKES